MSSTLDVTSPASVARFVRDRPTAVVCTVTPTGDPQAARVWLAADDDGTLVFNSDRDSRKVANLVAGSSIAVVVGFAGGVSLQVEGVARITEGVERDRWAALHAAQATVSRAADPQFVVVAIRPLWLRCYDVTTTPSTVLEARWPAQP